MTKTILTLGLAFLLISCGGGGDRGTPAPPATGTPGAGAGAGPPPQTVFEERTARILALNPAVLASDTLERTSLNALNASRPSERAAPFACNAGRCTHPFVEGEHPISEVFDGGGG